MIGSVFTRRFKIIIPVLFALLLLFAAILQYNISSDDLAGKTLQKGRIVLSSGEYHHHRSDLLTNGKIQNVIDNKLNQAAILPYPAKRGKHPYLLVDLALSHWPASAPDGTPLARKPGILIFYNGICADCPREQFERYSRIKEARIEILNRHANNPDREYHHEHTFPVRTFTQKFPDRPGPFTIMLSLPPAGYSPAYPENVYYIIVKITITKIYPGSVYADRVALAEIIYGDRDLNETLRGRKTYDLWR